MGGSKALGEWKWLASECAAAAEPVTLIPASLRPASSIDGAAEAIWKPLIAGRERQQDPSEAQPFLSDNSQIKTLTEPHGTERIKKSREKEREK